MSMLNNAFAKKRILLVDDSPFFLDTLSNVLGKEFQITKANSGEEALGLLDAKYANTTSQTLPFDLVVTDCHMPGMNGFDVAQYVRGRNRENRYVPVIMLTEKDIGKEETRKNGCAAFVPKSNLQKVKSMVRILLNNK